MKKYYYLFIAIFAVAIFGGSLENSQAAIFNPIGGGGGSGGVTTGTIISVGSPFTVGGTQSSTLTGNGSASIIPNLNGALFVPNNFATAGCFGVATATDIGRCINLAYAALPSTGGVIIPPIGAFTYTTPIVFGTNFKPASLYCWSGGGGSNFSLGGGTVLTYNSSTGSAFSVDTNNYIVSGVGIFNCGIQGTNGTTARSTVGINVGRINGSNNGAFDFQIRGVDVSGFGTGVQYNSNTSFDTIDSSNIHFNGRNVDEPDTAGANCENMRISNSVIADANNQAGGDTDLYGMAVQESGNCQWNIIQTSFDDNQVYINQFGGTANVWTFTNDHWENPNQHTYDYVNTLANVPATEVSFVGGDLMNDVVGGMPEFISTGGDFSFDGTTIDGNNNVTTKVTAVVLLDNADNNASVSWKSLKNNGNGAINVVSSTPMSPEGYATGIGTTYFVQYSTSTNQIGTSTYYGPFQIKSNNLIDSAGTKYVTSTTGGQASASSTQFVFGNASNLGITSSTFTVSSYDTYEYADQFAGADMGAQINAAYLACPSSGCTIIIPAGSFSYSTPIVFGTQYKPVILRGAGAAGFYAACPTTLIYTSSTGIGLTYNVINYSSAGVGMFNLCLFGPAGISGTGSSTTITNTTSTQGVHLGGGFGATGFHMDGVHISGWGKGVQFDTNTFIVNIDNSVIEKNGMALYEPGVSNAYENDKITNSLIGDCNYGTGSIASNCVYLNSSIQSADWIFEGDDFDDAQINLATAGNANQILHLFGNHFENPNSAGTGCYDFVTSAAGQVANNTIFSSGNTYLFANGATCPEEVLNGGNFVTSGDTLGAYSTNSTTTVRFVTNIDAADTLFWSGLNSTGLNGASQTVLVYASTTYTPAGFATGSSTALYSQNSSGTIRVAGITMTSGGTITANSSNLIINGTANNLLLQGLSGVVVSGTKLTANNGFTLANASGTFTTGSIGGGSLTAGTCASTTTALDPSIVTSTAVFLTTPKIDPGPDFYWETTLIASSSVSTRVCAAGITGTPTASNYNIKIIQ